MGSPRHRRFRPAQQDAEDRRHERQPAPLTIDVARDEYPLYVGSTLLTPELREQVRRVVRARQGGAR